jgi:hypothetical protein
MLNYDLITIPIREKSLEGIQKHVALSFELGCGLCVLSI